MNKHFLPLLATGLILGSALQINAMEEALPLAPQAASDSSSNPLPNPLPNNLSTNPSFKSDNRFTRISEVESKIRRYAYAKNLNISTNNTPQVLVLFGVRDNKLGYGVYSGTVGNDKMTFMKFIPYAVSISDYNDIKEKDLLPQAREILEEALRELEKSAAQNNK